MSWQGIEGHDSVVEPFRLALQRGRLASTFLFIGPDGIGKRMFAKKLAQAFLCERRDERELAPCESCPACQQVVSETHPDLELVKKAADRNVIPVDVFIGDREHRMRTGMCHRISLSPVSGKRRVAIVDDADFLNQEGANCLLKTLEEPPARCVIILIGTSEQRQLPTIRSRSQIIRFQGLSPALIEQLLVADGTSLADARRVKNISQGSLARARLFLGSELLQQRESLWNLLGTRPLDRRQLAKLMTEATDAVGKETAAKREQLREIADAAIEFYRELLWQVALAGGQTEIPVDTVEAGSVANDLAGRSDSLRDTVRQLLADWTGQTDAITSCLDRCLAAHWQTDANANLPALIDAWCADLTNVHRTRLPLAAV